MNFYVDYLEFFGGAAGKEAPCSRNPRAQRRSKVVVDTKKKLPTRRKTSNFYYL
jgi:hypothetical protein